MLIAPSSRHQAADIERQDEFVHLNSKLQYFISGLAKGQTQVSELIRFEAIETRNIVKQEGKDLKDHLDKRFQDLQISAINEKQCEVFLASLRFNEINARRSDVKPSYLDTCAWIFDETIERPWDSFVHWLQMGQDIYWINGKPGSGKSTLMKFICEHRQTREALRVWATPNGVQILSHFFWRPGTSMQKSTKGLLCSLLSQVLQQNRFVLSSVLQSDQSLIQKQNVYDWSVPELELTLSKAFGFAAPTQFCVFLDGLDEFDDDKGAHYLIATIKQLFISPKVKFCISSRPEIPIERELHKYPKLKLQELTRDDIKTYVDGLLEDARRRGLLSENKAQQQKLAEQVLDKASGVFLWVFLVMKNILAGLGSQDDWPELRQSLDLLPDDIIELYNHMWDRLGDRQEIYRQTAALYFSFRSRYPLSIFEVMVATSPDVRKTYLEDESQIPEKELVELCEKTRSRILTRSTGMLEIVNEPPTSANTDIRTTLSHFYHFTKVNFVHRTALDFLTQSRAGQSILNASKTSDREIFTWLNASRLVVLIEHLVPLNIQQIHEEILHLQKHLSVDVSPEAECEALLMVDKFCERIVSQQVGLVLGDRWYSFLPGRRNSGMGELDSCFLDLTVLCGLRSLMRDRLSRNNTSESQLTHLLACTALHWRNDLIGMAESFVELLEAGANPSAPVQFVKCRQEWQVSAWKIFLSAISLRGKPADAVTAITHAIDTALASGAGLDEKSVWFIAFSDNSREAGSWCDAGEPQLFGLPNIAVEINAAWLISGWFQSRHLNSSVSPSDGQASRTVLFVGDGTGKFARVDSEEHATFLLANFDRLLPGFEHRMPVDWKENEPLLRFVQEVVDHNMRVDPIELLQGLGHLRLRQFD